MSKQVKPIDVETRGRWIEKFWRDRRVDGESREIDSYNGHHIDLDGRFCYNADMLMGRVGVAREDV